MSLSQKQFDFFGFLGKYVNFQELEEAKLKNGAPKYLPETLKIKSWLLVKYRYCIIAYTCYK
jgi:hypothetical protein